MKIISFNECNNKDYWMEQILKSDWDARLFLDRAYKEKEIRALFGKHLDILLLVENDQLISYCTYAEFDEIQPTELTPWVGFVYTFPKYRGNRYMGLIFEEISKLAQSDNYSYIYLSTNHTSVYEKYGFEFYQILNDIQGHPSRIYRKKIK
jgi:predicted acetyltransferase